MTENLKKTSVEKSSLSWKMKHAAFKLTKGSLIHIFSLQFYAISILPFIPSNINMIQLLKNIDENHSIHFGIATDFNPFLVNIPIS